MSSVTPVEAAQVVDVPTIKTGDDPILEIRDSRTSFFLERGAVRAVRGVNPSLARQSTLGVVGESGCGKSVTAMSVMRLIKSPPGRIVDGEMWLHWDGQQSVDLASLDPKGAEIRSIRGGDVPALREITPDHFASCHFADEITLRGIEI